MRSGQILVSETSSRGVQALRDYLSFVETGRLVGAGKPTGKEPDSDFEISVIDALQKKGYQCEPQLGVEGYFIDLAVRDPGMPGRYLMGVECDGATYHRAKSTRDRDRVRQSVLEGLGWNIKRIWSTDWFKNPDAELKPILEELATLSSQPDEQSAVEPVEVKHTIKDLFHDDTRHELEQEFIDSNTEGETIADRLDKFQEQVISKRFPDTAEHKRLLRPEMLMRLASEAPVDRDEFLQMIPQYLRTGTELKETEEFLDDVLEIIAEFEAE